MIAINIIKMSGRVKAEQNPYFTSYDSALSSISATDVYTNYSYDAVDRVIQVRNTDGTLKNITFNQWNITDYDENGHKHQYLLDSRGQITAVLEFVQDPIIGINETFYTGYEYDDNGNLIQITDNEGNVFEFAYDPLGRKISMDDPDVGHWTYSYDTNGNLNFQLGGGGNLITGDGYYREYDGQGQLIRVRNGSSSTSPVLENYTYDHSGQRIKIWRNDSANTTIYTPFPEMMRIVNSSGTYDYYYIYHEGQLVARKNPDGTTTQIHTDHLGSSTVSTNATQGIVEKTTYDPYGVELSGGNYDVKGYTGQFDDELTQQMYYGARYYVPSRGMFVQPDPVMQNVYDPQFLNHYAYVRNNPYILVDPDGKSATPYHAIGVYDALVDLGFSKAEALNLAYHAMDPDIKNRAYSEHPDAYGQTYDETHLGPQLYLDQEGLNSQNILEKNARDFLDFLGKGDSALAGSRLHVFGDTVHLGSPRGGNGMMDPGSRLHLYRDLSPTNIWKTSTTTYNYIGAALAVQHVQSNAQLNQILKSSLAESMFATASSSKKVTWYYSSQKNTYTWRVGSSNPGKGYAKIKR